MRITSSTLVFLAALLLSLSSFVGSLDAFAKDAGGKKKSFAKDDGSKKQTKSEPKPMDAKPDGNSRVFTYLKTGGFIGVDLKYEKNLAELGSDERQKLESLIAESGLLNAKSDEHITGGAADMYHYEFRYKDGSKDHHVRFDDGTIPESYRPLVQYLKDKTVDQRRR